MSFIQVKKLGHKFNIKDKDGNVTRSEEHTSELQSR